MLLKFRFVGNAISALALAFVLSLFAMNTPVWADDIKNLERKIEYLKQKKVLDAQLQDIQGKLQALENKYKDVAGQSSTKPDTGSSQVSSNTSSGITPFSEIMRSMHNKDIELEFINGYRPFKVLKDGEKWFFEQQRNYQRSEIISGGENIISATGFPPNWPINGSWKFSKDGNKCRIDHTEDVGNMTWEC